MQRANESRELKEWLRKAVTAKKLLRDLDGKGHVKNTHTIEETKHAISELEVCLYA